MNYADDIECTHAMDRGEGQCVACGKYAEEIDWHDADDESERHMHPDHALTGGRD